MALLLSEDDVRVLLDVPTALEAVEDSFRLQASGEGWARPRQRLELPSRAFLNYMAAADRKNEWMGMKIYSVARGVVRFVVLLYNAGTGELAAIIEADYLGQMRTGAATGVATKYMSRSESSTVAMIGTGLQARTQLEAVAEVRKIESVRAFGRDPVRRAQFCREMTERLGLPVTAAMTAQEAAEGADIVITMTTSDKPILSAAWLAPGTHVNAAGANLLSKRELETDAVNVASTIAVDSLEQARMESGDLIAAFEPDPARWERVIELAGIVSGKLPGRAGARDITLFKSNGIASWDIAVAARVFERARQESVGRHIPLCEITGDNP